MVLWRTPKHLGALVTITDPDHPRNGKQGRIFAARNKGEEVMIFFPVNVRQGEVGMFHTGQYTAC